MDDKSELESIHDRKRQKPHDEKDSKRERETKGSKLTETQTDFFLLFPSLSIGRYLLLMHAGRVDEQFLLPKNLVVRPCID
jgi:hypothetical protein